MNELHLFAGAGGGILGGVLLGHKTVCAVEIDGYCSKILLQRQRDGILPWFPIWDDVRTFDGRPWKGIADFVCGGFPCQDISCGGTTTGNKGLDGDRSGLWKQMVRVISEVEPRGVFVENSPMLTQRGLGIVLGNLADMGFDARWGVVSAANAGAPHIRERIWILAYSRCFSGEIRNQMVERYGDVLSKRDHGGTEKWGKDWEFAALAPGVSERSSANWWRSQRRVDRSTNGMAHRMDRLHAIGNGQVPVVAALAWRLLRFSN